MLAAVHAHYEQHVDGRMAEVPHTRMGASHATGRQIRYLHEAGSLAGGGEDDAADAEAGDGALAAGAGPRGEDEDAQLAIHGGVVLVRQARAVGVGDRHEGHEAEGDGHEVPLRAAAVLIQTIRCISI